jgi:DNA processing protein
MPIEWEARARDFPRRNRIVSGLALGVVVVEAARGSGSLITARIAAEQNREVFAVPGSPLDPRAEGANDLLRDGAHLCARVEDVLSVLEPLRARDPRTLFAEGAAQGGEALWGAEGLKNMAAPAGGADDDGDQSRAASSERDAARRIVAMLSPSPISLDDLARAAEASAREVRVALIELELAGQIEFSGGNRVALRGFDAQS